MLHYRIVDKIGEGGVGVVCHAVDTMLGREVAVAESGDSLGEPLVTDDANKQPGGFSPTTRGCCISRNDPKRVSDPWLVAVEGDRGKCVGLG